MPEWDQVEGKAKEIQGEITGDEGREAEGELQGGWGDVKDKAGGTLDDAKDAVDDRM